MFFTQVELKESKNKIDHLSNLFFCGSCFSENISKILKEQKFKVLTNPFGILYDPESISIMLDHISQNKNYSKKDLFYFNELWHSQNHHSDFSSLEVEKTLKNINTSINIAHDFIKQTDFLIITLGTSIVRYKIDTNEPVGNCHKLPSNLFYSKKLNPSEIFEILYESITKIRRFNNKIKVIVNVSPIRHLKEGAKINQLSKSSLLLACEMLEARLDEIYYFPSYEIMLDELRDYRYYNEDMIHPSNQAINYIYQKFKSVFFTQNTMTLIKRIEEINLAIGHRAFNKETKSYKVFCDKMLLKIDKIKTEFDFIDFSNEQRFFKNKQN